MGDAVNLASRIEGVSKVGQILVGPATYKATKTGFEYKALQPVSLKGKAEPVPVYELLSIKETLYRVEPGADRMISSAMVGRDSGLNKLELAILKAIDSEGLIMNADRCRQASARAPHPDFEVSTVMKKVILLEGRAISMGANLGYHLIIDLLETGHRSQRMTQKSLHSPSWSPPYVQPIQRPWVRSSPLSPRSWALSWWDVMLSG